MPLVQNRNLRSWERLAGEGVDIVDASEIRADASNEVHIGFLNMMPARAVIATERQFLRLASAANEYYVHIHPFTVDGLDRHGDILEYMQDAYDSFSQIQSRELDGLIMTGANPGEAELKTEAFWPQYEQVIYWAQRNIPTIMCSCLATHAVLQALHGIERTRCEPGKRWGVYSHNLLNNTHHLTQGIDSVFETPRSHVFEMKAKQLADCGIEVLATSKEADFHLAVSEDGFKWIFLQGHPEYDAISLLKEYKREVHRFVDFQISDYPDYPLNYFSRDARNELTAYKNDVIRARDNGLRIPELPEPKITDSLRNTWSEQGKILFANWIRKIGQSVAERKQRNLSKAMGL